jgi:hypothetical protein
MLKLTAYLFVAFFCFWIQPVMAYIDPGSGSAIMSAVIGFFVAIGLAVKTYWYKLKSLFLNNKSEKEENSTTDNNNN